MIFIIIWLICNSSLVIMILVIHETLEQFLYDSYFTQGYIWITTIGGCSRDIGVVGSAGIVCELIGWLKVSAVMIWLVGVVVFRDRNMDYLDLV